MKIKRLLIATLAATMIISALAVSASASTVENDYAEFNATTVDYDAEQSHTAILDPNNDGIMPRAEYTVKAHKQWIKSNGIGVGCEGWTNLISSNNVEMFHYSNACVYPSSLSEGIYSGRNWGTGNVPASTGNVGKGACYSIEIYYGF